MIDMKLLLSNSSRYSIVRIFALVYPWKKRNTVYFSASDRIFRDWNYRFHWSCGQFSLQTSRHTRVRGSDIRAEWRPSAPWVFPVISLSLFFYLPLPARRMIVRILKCQSEGKRKESKEEYSILLDSCHGHVSDAREQWELDTLAGPARAQHPRTSEQPPI